MAGTKQICVICEGKSEVGYLAVLTRLLGRLSQDRGNYFQPIAFAGKPPGRGVGTGAFEKVQTAFFRERRQSPKSAFLIWTDADLAVREAASAPDRFRLHLPILLGGKNGQPPFLVSSVNFEDFLALHFDDGLYEEWKAVFLNRGHFRAPLQAEEYVPLFRPFWKRSAGAGLIEYQKGALPAGWLDERALRNLFRHCDDPDVLPPVKNLTPQPTFGEFLRTEILSVFPDLSPAP